MAVRNATPCTYESAKRVNCTQLDGTESHHTSGYESATVRLELLSLDYGLQYPAQVRAVFKRLNRIFIMDRLILDGASMAVCGWVGMRAPTRIRVGIASTVLKAWYAGKASTAIHSGRGLAPAGHQGTPDHPQSDRKHKKQPEVHSALPKAKCPLLEALSSPTIRTEFLVPLGNRR